MKRLMLFATLCLFGLSLYSQQTKILTAEKHNEYGLIYTLPVTSFQVEVVAMKETQISGPYSKYSKIFTSESKVISEDKINWTIESVKVTPFGIPNPDSRYLMQLKAGATTFIEVADDGMLLSINTETNLPEPESLSVTEIEGTPVNGKEFMEYVNEDFIAAQSSYKKAQLLAEELMDIRDAKISLTRGTAETMPTDGRQLEIMLAALEKQEKALMNAFTGSSWKERIVRTFTVTPAEEGREMICRLNLSQGIVDASAKGEPLYMNIKLVEEAQLPVDAKGEEKKLPKDAVVYCVPGTAEISVSFNNRILYQKDFQMSQFGMLYGLSPSIFTDKKEPSYAIFDPTTGALKELGTLKEK